MVCIGLVLAEVMKMAKEIRPDDKNAGPLRLGAGRLCGLLVMLLLPADDLGGGCAGRLIPFLGAGDARRDWPAAGVMVCRRCRGLAMIRRRSAATIRQDLNSY